MKRVVGEMQVKHLIALCYILDQFEEFDKNVISFLSVKSNRDLIHTLAKVSKGERYRDFGLSFKFYRDNKKIIDIINEYSDINYFLRSIYGNQWNLNKNSNLDFFYQYMLKNKNQLNHIVSLLKKIDKLGFEKIIFSEGFDFTYTEHRMNSDLSDFNIIYLDNIEILPCHEDYFRYKSTGSNFKMELSLFGCKEIRVNSLLFSPDKLPDSADKQFVFNLILAERDRQREKIVGVSNSINLGLGIMKVSDDLDLINKIVSELDNNESSAKIIEQLLVIKEELKKLECINSEYYDSLLEKDSTLTKDFLEREKGLVLKKKRRG